MNRRSIFKTALFGLLPKKAEAISPKVAGDFITPQMAIDAYGPIQSAEFLKRYPNGVKVNAESLRVLSDEYLFSVVHRLRLSGEFELYPNGIYRSKNGLLHSDIGPAFITKNTQTWYQYGVIHRDNGPASIWKSKESWFRYGKLHRENGPAVIDKQKGIEKYYKDGKFQKTINTVTGQIFYTDGNYGENISLVYYSPKFGYWQREYEKINPYGKIWSSE